MPEAKLKCKRCGRPCDWKALGEDCPMVEHLKRFFAGTQPMWFGLRLLGHIFGTVQ